MLRANPGIFDKAHATFFKGVFWARLGDLESALVFSEEAVRIEPTNAEFVTALLKTLTALERTVESTERAIAISEKHANVIPERVISSAKYVVKKRRAFEEVERELKETERKLHEAEQELNGEYTALFEVKRAILQADRETHSGHSLFGDDESPDDDRPAIFAA